MMRSIVLIAIGAAPACKAEQPTVAAPATQHARDAAPSPVAPVAPRDASPPDDVTSLAGDLDFIGGVVRLTAAPNEPLGMVNLGTAIWVRTYSAAPLDVTEKLRMVDPVPVLRAIRNGEAAVFHWRELVARPAHGAPKHQHKARLITWDVAANHPVVSDRYDCDETQDTCNAPPVWFVAD